MIGGFKPKKPIPPAANESIESDDTVSIAAKSEDRDG